MGRVIFELEMSYRVKFKIILPSRVTPQTIDLIIAWRNYLVRTWYSISMKYRRVYLFVHGQFGVGVGVGVGVRANSMKWHSSKAQNTSTMIRPLRNSDSNTLLVSILCSSRPQLLHLHTHSRSLRATDGIQKGSIECNLQILMEDLPESILQDILKRIDRTADKNSISLVCKRLHRIEGEQRDFLRVGCRLHPAIEAFSALCTRFPNLSKLEIVYSGWNSSMGGQLGDEGLQVLSSKCPALEELSLNFCTFISDTFLFYLYRCRNLTSLKLISTPAISSYGLLSLTFYCKNLSTLHLIGCMKVSRFEWLERLGNLGNLRELFIKNCRGVSEDDLIRLGPGWKKLRRLDFAVDAYNQYPRIQDQLSLSEWNREVVYCDELKDLSLTNCMVVPGQGLSFLLGRCDALEKLQLDMCIGLTHNDIVALSQKSSNLRSLAMCLPTKFPESYFGNNLLALKDDSLRALAAGCPMLHTLELSFSDWDIPFSDWDILTISYFTLDAVIALIHSCPIRVLSLQSACFLNDRGMKALCTAQHLQVLELTKCHEVSDEGLKHIIRSPSLKTVKLCKCLEVTDFGLKPLVNSQKLDLLMVQDCPHISEKGVKGAARSISYKQEFSWLN